MKLLLSNYNNITWNTLKDNVQFGIYLHKSNNTIVTRNILNRNPGDGIGEALSINNLIAVNNINGSTTPLTIYESGGIVPIPNLRWHQVVLFDWCSGNGTKDNPYVIKDLVFNATQYYYGINVVGSENLYFTIENCTVFDSMYYGIQFTNTMNGTLTTNNCSNNGDAGIYLSGSDNNTITGNTASFNGVSGIYLINSHNNSITDNTANNNDLYGIHLKNSYNNTISDNVETINYNDICGIFLENSNGNDIINNIANYNGKYGMCLNNSDYNNVIGNTLIGNQIPYFQDENCDGNVFEDNFLGGGVIADGGDDDEDDRKKTVVEIPIWLLFLIGIIIVIGIVIIIVKLRKR
jgi:parallel beta-helix repeat protein